MKQTQRTISALKENNVREIDGVPASLLQRVAWYTEVRFQECARRDGRHLDEIIFKKNKTRRLCNRY